MPTGIAGMEDLAKDTGAGLVVGITQVTEILANPGVKLVGPLPGDLQNITTYAALLGARPADLSAAEAFLAWLTGSAAKQAFAAAGFNVAPCSRFAEKGALVGSGYGFSRGTSWVRTPSWGTLTSALNEPGFTPETSRTAAKGPTVL